MDSGFIPSQLDQHRKVNLNSDSNLNPLTAEQNFFTSFFRSGQQILPSRPFSTRHNSALTSERFISSYKNNDESILGSGDFTVLKGGTFYPEGERIPQPYYGSGSSFYDSSNTGRPFALPLESSHYLEDPFANFKDFADIAGLDTDFTQMVETYKEKHEPKNIFEQLQQIDEEKSEKQAHLVDSTIIPTNNRKQSKSKTKLSILKKMKEPMKREFIKNIDPLVAES